MGLRKTQNFCTRSRPITKIGDIFRATRRSLVSSQAVLNNCVNELSQITFNSIY